MIIRVSRPGVREGARTGARASSTRRAARAALGALLALTFLAPAPAAAAAPEATAAGAPGDPVRYAFVRRCTEDGTPTPCGPWRLRMRSGRTVRHPDARVHPRTARGAKVANRTAPFAISGDGGTVAYFRGDDRLVVRRIGGPVRALPYRPDGTDLVTLYLSGDGGRLAAETGGDPERRPAVVYDTATGAVALRLPGSLVFQGFGGENGTAVLTAAPRGDTVTRLAAFGPDGVPLFDVAPPRAVADNGPYALAPDGRTVAFVDDGERAALGLYDARAGTLRRIPLRLAADDIVDGLGWSGETLVTVRLSRLGGRQDTIRVLQVDTATGAARVRESYTIGGDVYGATPDA